MDLVTKIRPYSKQPILVWTMGKVGSSTISYSLFMAGFYTLDIHTLFSPQVTDLSPDPSSQDGNNRLPYHIVRSRRAGDLLESGTAPIEIITAVREPIGRNLSAFFQNVKKADLEGKTNDQVIALFKDSYPQHIPLRWFDNEILKGTGVDLLDRPFDHDRGWAIHEEGHFRFLTIKLDGPEDAMRGGLAAFLGEAIPIASQNESRGKFYANIYNNVKGTIDFNNDEITSMYNSRYAKTFWTPSELKALAQRWSAAHREGP